MEASSSPSFYRLLEINPRQCFHFIMEFEGVRVTTRDEYRADQDPTGFEWRGKLFEVAKIVDRWYEGYPDPTRMPLRYFKVLTKNGEQFILRYHEFFRAWGLLIQRRGRER